MPEERERRLKDDRDQQASRRATEPPEERERRLKDERDRKKSQRATETPAARELRLTERRARAADSRAAETPEERERRLAHQRNRDARRATKTKKEEKEKRNELRRQRYAASNTERKQALVRGQQNDQDTLEDHELRLADTRGRNEERERRLTERRIRDTSRRATETEKAEKGKRNERRRQKYAASNTEERNELVCCQQHAMGKSEKKQTEKKTHKAMLIDESKHEATEGESKQKKKPRVDTLGSTWSPFETTLKDSDGGLRHSQWSDLFRQLCEYKVEFGHCNVPTRYSVNPKLGKWVSTQRTRYRTNLVEKSTSIIAEHIRALNGVGFDWGTSICAQTVFFTQLTRSVAVE